MQLSLLTEISRESQSPKLGKKRAGSIINLCARSEPIREAFELYNPVARRAAPSSGVYYGRTTPATKARHPEHQSHFTKPKSELRQERKDPIS
jgi:hypothetical protein